MQTGALLPQRPSYIAAPPSTLATHTSCSCFVGGLQVLLARLLFLSVLVMALYTLFEADRRPEVADAVAGEANWALIIFDDSSQGCTCAPSRMCPTLYHIACMQTSTSLLFCYA